MVGGEEGRVDERGRTEEGVGIDLLDLVYSDTGAVQDGPSVRSDLQSKKDGESG